MGGRAGRGRVEQTKRAVPPGSRSFSKKGRFRAVLRHVSTLPRFSRPVKRRFLPVRALPPLSVAVAVLSPAPALEGGRGVGAYLTFCTFVVIFVLLLQTLEKSRFSGSI